MILISYFNYEFRCTSLPLSSLPFLECPFLVCHPLFSPGIRLSETRSHSLRGGCSSQKLSEKLSVFSHSLTFQLTCLINTADCFVNDSFEFSKGKTSFQPMYSKVAHAHRANLAYHSEFFRLLSS